MVIFSLFLVYPLVSSTIFRIFVCKRIYGIDYLLADFTKECYTSEWRIYTIYASVMILVYPIGVPAFFFYMLWRYRRHDRLHEPGVMSELGFLYSAYDSGFVCLSLPRSSLSLFLSHSLFSLLPRYLSFLPLYLPSLSLPPAMMSSPFCFCVSSPHIPLDVCPSPLFFALLCAANALSSARVVRVCVLFASSLIFSLLPFRRVSSLIFSLLPFRRVLCFAGGFQTVVADSNTL